MKQSITTVAIILLAASVIMVNFKIHDLQDKITKLENQPALELTCAIPDRKGRYVCRYIEVVR